MKKLFVLAIVTLLAFTMILNVNKANAETAENNPIYTENFEGETLEGYSGNITNTNGKGVYNGNGTWTQVPCDPSKSIASNNLDIEFDMAYNDNAESYFHLVHLDGTGNDRNIYFAIVANGQYLKLSDYDGNDIYDNSGLDQGSHWQTCKSRLNDLEVGCHFRFIVCDDVIEIQIDGERIITVALSAFGNNRYQQRKAITKGIVDGIAFDFRCASGNAWIDNFSVKEFVKDTTKTSYVRTDRIGGAGEYLPLGIENLYQPNFMAKVSFEVMRAEVEDNNGGDTPYPKLQLLLNQLYARQMSNPENYFNVQLALDREFSNPWMGGLNDSVNWCGQGLEYTQGSFAHPTIHTITVEVYGDNIKFMVDSNGADTTPIHREVTTTFSALGIKKGPLLGINLANHYTDVVYFEYQGYAEDKASTVKLSKESITEGNEVTATATLFGAVSGEFKWYIDGQATTETALTITKTFNDEGEHTFEYKSDAVSSNIAKLNVVGRIVEIAADVTELYCDGVVNFTSTKQGEFTDALVWTVNGVQQEASGDTFTLNQLTSGTTYTVTASAHGVTSNEVVVTVKASEVTIASEKGSYDQKETVVVEPTFKGVAAEDTLTWYVDGKEVANPDANLTLALSEYAGGSTHTIKVVTKSGIASNELTITVVYDLKEAVKNNEYYKTVYEQKITAESDQNFGGYVLVTNEGEDPYYRCTNATGGNDASFGGLTVTSTKWALDYDILIPQTVVGEYYVYPQFLGVDTKHPNDQVEMAIAINATGIRTYIKFHDRGINLEESEYGTGADLAYTGSVVKQGAWNHISVVFDGTFIAFYVNDVMTFFADVPNTTIPAGATMSTWMANASISAEVTGYKNFTISAIVEPAPAVSAVSVSASKISGKVGDSITLNASVTPFNAEPKSIEWTVNGVKVTGADQLSYILNATEAKEYSVVCIIDGISSPAKVITITADTPVEPEPAKKGCGKNAAAQIIALMTACSVLFVFLKRK